jgi:hypothetical protein
VSTSRPSGLLLNDDGRSLGRRPTPEHHRALRRLAEGDERETEGGQRQLRRAGGSVLASASEVEAGFERAVAPRLLVAYQEPGDEADTLRPHAVERLSDPAGVELLGNAFGIGRTRVPGELGHPEGDSPPRSSASRATARRAACASSTGPARRCRSEGSRDVWDHLTCTGCGLRCRSEPACGTRVVVCRRRGRAAFA